MREPVGPDGRCQISDFRFLAPLALLVLWVPACGKVSDPLPPAIEIPERVADFTVSQVGYDLRFLWTNPSRNVDLSPSTDLERVVILADGEVILEAPVSGPGEPQSGILPARDLVGTARRFSIRLETGHGRASDPSDAVELGVVEVSGPVSGLRARVDQDRITLEWDPPSVNPELVDSFRIYRSGEVVADVPLTAFEDSVYVRGSTYSYVVAGVRSGGGGAVEGIASAPLEVDALDTLPPAAPAGLALRVFEDSAFLTWEPGPESDIVGYRVLRREGPDGPFLPLTAELLVATGYNDPAHTPGDAYAVSAVDRSGNESPPSEPVGE